MKKLQKDKTIKVNFETWQALTKLGQENETYNNIIKRIIKEEQRIHRLKAAIEKLKNRMKCRKRRGLLNTFMTRLTS